MFGVGYGADEVCGERVERARKKGGGASRVRRATAVVRGEWDKKMGG